MPGALIVKAGPLPRRGMHLLPDKQREELEVAMDRARARVDEAARAEWRDGR